MVWTLGACIERCGQRGGDSRYDPGQADQAIPTALQLKDLPTLPLIMLTAAVFAQIGVFAVTMVPWLLDRKAEREFRRRYPHLG